MHFDFHKLCIKNSDFNQLNEKIIQRKSHVFDVGK